MARQSQPVPQLPLILLTRPQAQSERFATALHRALGGAEVLISPLMAARFLQPEVPLRDWQGIIFTSETGAEAARQLSAEGAFLPPLAFCVGNRTAAAARDAGFEARSAQGDAAALVAYLLHRKVAGPLLHLRGKDSRGDVEETLSAGGTETVSVICYEQVQVPPRPEMARVLRGTDPVLVPLFSPRSAQFFAALVAGTAITAPLWVVALSAAVVQGLGGFTPQRLMIAGRPEHDAMLAACLVMLGRETGS